MANHSRIANENEAVIKAAWLERLASKPWCSSDHRLIEMYTEVQGWFPRCRTRARRQPGQFELVEHEAGDVFTRNAHRHSVTIDASDASARAVSESSRPDRLPI